jgi:AcrR family transcriptional regulator
MIETDKKREQIIVGAIKRFTHYGINKTTMNEIADDLSVSKPALYYYFPDKSSLILGVVSKIFEDYFELLDKEKTFSSIEERFASMIEIRHRFFQKYYMLHLSSGTTESSLNTEEIKAYVMEMKNKDLELHSQMLQEAIKQGEVDEDIDPKKTAALYLQCMAGITSLCIMNGNKELMPSKKDVKMVLEKQLDLSKIFIKGLKK